LEDHKRKIGESQKGRHASEESQKKMRESQKQQGTSENQKEDSIF
jgi:hypothetical protein